MWILHLLPDSLLIIFINIILAIGALGAIASFFVKFVPFINNYRLPILIVSIILLLLGTYFKGGYVVEKEWRDRVDELQKQIAIAQAKSAEANVEIQTKYITKTKVVHDVKVKVQQQIVEKEKLIDSECTISQEVIDILNESARGGKE